MADINAAFTGSVPGLYTRYVGPIFFAPYAADLASRVKAIAPRRLLETACGTGIVTRALAAALPDTVAITATDLNQPMIDFAKLQPGAERSSGSRRMQRVSSQNAPAATGCPGICSVSLTAQCSSNATLPFIFRALPHFRYRRRSQMAISRA
jgi:SAM-dependent methyltransferase